MWQLFELATISKFVAFSVVIQLLTKNYLSFMYIYDFNACKLLPPFQINVLGTSSDVPIMNVLDVLIYVMVSMTAGTIQIKTIVEVK